MQTKYFLRVFLLAVGLLAPGVAGTIRAAPITYAVTVDTSALPPGTAGSLEMQLNPGGSSAQGVTATVFNFTSDGTLNGTSTNAPPMGNASGDLAPSPTGQVVLNNGTAWNDLVENFTYGNSFTFLVQFSGPALDAPNSSAAGSTFALTLWDGADATGNQWFGLPDNSGAALEININPDGTTTSSATPTSTPVSAQIVPEPGTLTLLAVSLAGLWTFRRRVRVVGALASALG